MDLNARDIVTVFGGSGFLGTQLVQLLARQGYRIRVAVRNPSLAGDLRPLGDVGQIAPVQANVRNAASVARAIAGARHVINLVGIGVERGAASFDAVHVEGARAVALAAREAGATSLVQMSVLGADRRSESPLVRSRAEGEAAVLEAFPNAIVVRAGIMFGPDDGFFNLMATLARVFPALPLIGGKTKLQPVYVKDVAEAIVQATEGKVQGGRIYELGGPEVLTHREVLGRIMQESGHNRLLVPLGAGLGKLLAAPMGLMPQPLLTADQVIQLQSDNVVSAAAVTEKRDISAFGISPTGMDVILPTYLWRFRRNGQFDRQTA
jgi:uncharacterized protein YbjT (DUF2867 family)